jgi:RNA 3'-terminal phosphate cyclase (ATP)
LKKKKKMREGKEATREDRNEGRPTRPIVTDESLPIRPKQPMTENTDARFADAKEKLAEERDARRKELAAAREARIKFFTSATERQRRESANAIDLRRIQLADAIEEKRKDYADAIATRRREYANATDARKAELTDAIEGKRKAYADAITRRRLEFPDDEADSRKRAPSDDIESGRNDAIDRSPTTREDSLPAWITITSPTPSLQFDHTTHSDSQIRSLRRPFPLDGRTLEGGGQLVRNALCLSALTGVSIKITHIRGGRPGGGGLKAQHLACVRWLAQACEAYVEGAHKGSRELLFTPGANTWRRRGQAVQHAGRMPATRSSEDQALPAAFSGRRVLDDGREVLVCHPLKIDTAGSTGLALQAVLPYLLFCRTEPAGEGGKPPGGVSPLERLPIRLTVTGGTNVSGSPSYDYVKHVLLPTLEGIGLPKMSVTLGQRWWSAGRPGHVGEFTIEIAPRKREDKVGTGLMCFDLGLSKQLTDPVYEPEVPMEIHAVLVGPAGCRAYFREALAANVARHFGAGFSFGDDGGVDNTGEQQQQQSPSPIAEDFYPPRKLTLTFEPTFSSPDNGFSRNIYILVTARIPSSTIPVEEEDEVHEKKGNNDEACSWTKISPPPTAALLAADVLHTQSSKRPIDLAEKINEMTERVVGDLAREWRSNAVVDEHLRDQLVIFQALALGRSGTFGGWEEGEEDQSQGRMGNTSTLGRGAHDEKLQREKEEEEEWYDVDTEMTVDPSTPSKPSPPPRKFRELSLHAKTAQWICQTLLSCDKSHTRWVHFDAEGWCDGFGFGVEKEDLGFSSSSSSSPSSILKYQEARPTTRVA